MSDRPRRRAERAKAMLFNQPGARVRGISGARPWVHLFVCVFAATLSAQTGQKPPEPAQPTFRAGANYVRLDMFATSDGQPVDDLTVEDIELTEDGARQTIESFEHVRVAPATAGAAPVEPTSVGESRQLAANPRARVFVIFLDTYHTQIEGSANMRLPLIRFLDRVLGADDLVALMTPEMSASDIALGRKTTVISNIMQAQWTWGRRGRLNDQDPKEDLYDACYGSQGAGDRADSTAAEMKARRREKLTLDALDDLVVHLGGIREERKAVLVVTEGWRLFRENRALAESDPSQRVSPGDVLRRAPRQRPEDQGSLQGATRVECETDKLALSMLDHSTRLVRLGEEANRGNVSFYPVFARGLVPFDAPIGPERPPSQAVDGAILSARQDSLRVIADNTDGLAVINTNNIDGALKRIVDDLSSYYLLGYYSTNAKLDGRFRSISVRVKRSGVRVRARRGYRGRSVDDLLPGAPSGSAAGPPESLSRALGSVASVNLRSPFRIRTAAWARPLAGGASQGSFWIVGELDFRTRRELAWTAGAQAEITVLGADGTAVDSRSVDVPAADGGFGIRVPNDASLKPGDYAVRVRIRPPGADDLALTDTARVIVPDGRSALGEAVLWRRGPSTGPRHLMTADPRFQRADRLRLELPTAAEGAPTARMLDRAGKPIQVPVAVGERPDASGLFRWITVDAALAPLAAGDYAIEVALGEAKQVTAFRMVP